MTVLKVRNVGLASLTGGRIGTFHAMAQARVTLVTIFCQGVQCKAVFAASASGFIAGFAALRVQARDAFVFFNIQSKSLHA